MNRLNYLLGRRLGERAVVAVQNPLRLSPQSEPQPDLAVLQPRDDFYTGSHPWPGDVLLVIEVADTSIAVDRVVKLPLYADAGIGEVWIVDLSKRRVIVNREPDDGVHTRIDIARSGDTVQPAAFDDLILTVDEILGA